MRLEVAVPNLPESVQDATLLEWKKRPGDRVDKGETLVELETDKVVLDVPAPTGGVVQEVLRSSGEIVVGGELLAVLETEVSTGDPSCGVSSKNEGGDRHMIAGQSSHPVSPAVRRLLGEHELDPALVSGSGKDGRISKQDVLDFLAAQKPATKIKAETVVPFQPPGSLFELRSDESLPASADAERRERRVPISRVRSRIAERLLDSQRNTATLTTFNEVNLQKIFDLRNLYKTRFEQEHQIKLGFMSFFVKAAVASLRRFPIVNASIDDDEIVYHDYYDIGIAVSTDRGLVVPILRDADRLDFGAIERAVVEFARKARDSKLSYEELSGGTFSITNGGIYGSMLSTPILNPPQSAILGMHAIKERPVVENGQVVIRPMIYLALSYDHRLIDGRDAVSFLFTVKELLEDPARMVLNV